MYILTIILSVGLIVVVVKTMSHSQLTGVVASIHRIGDDPESIVVP
jgi:hypothetical protein